ncbi:MAG: hypothetical protein M3Y56_13705 [Armatimonadota bacterium]|nr:hypothetical protein [Armatimonadota bacterium]
MAVIPVTVADAAIPLLEAACARRTGWVATGKDADGADVDDKGITKTENATNVLLKFGDDLIKGYVQVVQEEQQAQQAVSLLAPPIGGS